MCGRVKNHRRMEAIKDVPHSRRVENVRHKRQNNSTVPTLNQFLLDRENLNLGLFDQQKPLRVERCDLAAKF